MPSILHFSSLKILLLGVLCLFSLASYSCGGSESDEKIPLQNLRIATDVDSDPNDALKKLSHKYKESPPLFLGDRIADIEMLHQILKSSSINQTVELTQTYQLSKNIDQSLFLEALTNIYKHREEFPVFWEPKSVMETIRAINSASEALFPEIILPSVESCESYSKKQIFHMLMRNRPVWALASSAGLGASVKWLYDLYSPPNFQHLAEALYDQLRNGIVYTTGYIPIDNPNPRIPRVPYFVPNKNIFANLCYDMQDAWRMPEYSDASGWESLFKKIGDNFNCNMTFMLDPILKLGEQPPKDWPSLPNLTGCITNLHKNGVCCNSIQYSPILYPPLQHPLTVLYTAIANDTCFIDEFRNVSAYDTVRFSIMNGLLDIFLFTILGMSLFY